MSTTKTINPHVRWMIRPDIPQVLSIEQSKVRPWAEEEFLEQLRKRNVIGMVAEMTEAKSHTHPLDYVVGGYMIYELGKHSLPILKFVANPGFDRKIILRTMMEKLKGKLSSHRRTSISIMVPETDMESLLFFRSQQFLSTEVSRGYFEEILAEDGAIITPSEDGILMEYHLPD